MTIKDMKYTTVEDVHKLREAAVKMEIEKEALAAHVEQCRQVSKRIQGYSLPEAKRCLRMALNAIDELPELTSARRDARMKAEGARAVRHLTRGDDWEDDELRQVIEDCAEGFRRQAQGETA